MKHEYGGYLPLEHFDGPDRFSVCGEKSVLRTNSAKSALYHAILLSGVRKIYTPHYMCASVMQLLSDLEIGKEYYYLDESLLPAVDTENAYERTSEPEKYTCDELSGARLCRGRIQEKTGFLITDYFGIMGAAVRRWIFSHPGFIYFIDDSHAFFDLPLPGSQYYNIYSCRKFFGVPDGGYLVHTEEKTVGNKAPEGTPDSRKQQENPAPEDMPDPRKRQESAGPEGTSDPRKQQENPGPEDPSDLSRLQAQLTPGKVHEHFSYLVTSAEEGTNASYGERKESDLFFRRNYKGMSSISRGLLSGVDYEKNSEIRRRNFAALHKILKADNLLCGDLPDECLPAYVYPFLPKYGGAALKKALVAEKIYVPTMWEGCAGAEFDGTTEQELSRNGVFLPVDQRYTEEDMLYIAGRVKVNMDLGYGG